MSTEQRLRVVDRTENPQGGDSAESQLDGTRAEADRIIAVASSAFERMRATNSQDFLSRSRQTGGQ